MCDADRGHDLEDSMEMHFFAQGHSIGTPGKILINFILFIDHSRCIAYYEDDLIAQKDMHLDPVQSMRPSRFVCLVTDITQLLDSLACTGTMSGIILCTSRHQNRLQPMHWMHLHGFMYTRFLYFSFTI
jgi:hypothetical protein